jgi:cell wall-associated NlpC family hydrolase
MFLRKLFPCVLAACSIFSVSLTVLAQNADLRPKQLLQLPDSNEATCSPDDPVIISEASAEDIKAATPAALPKILRGDTFQQLMSAIDQRLGSPYRWGGTGPNAFDCSGFVWSIFQSAGINFERGSARTLWGRFEAPAPEDRYKFGTLVFFSGLAHVGVVVDEQGFYHASRHHGVIYSPFNDYWLTRVDGFRRVPLAVTRVTD